MLVQADAEKKVQAWFDRHRVMPPAKNAVKEEPPHETEATIPPAVPEAEVSPETPETPEVAQETPDASAAPSPEVAASEPGKPRIPAATLTRRLNSLKHQI